MTDISRQALFGKLNPLAYKSVEGATVFCKLRGNPYVELVHWIQQMLQLQDSDLLRIVRQFGCDPARIAQGITDALDELPRGARTVDFSQDLGDATREGWMHATLAFGDAQVRTGYLVVGILNDRHLKNTLLRISKEFEKIELYNVNNGERFSTYIIKAARGSGAISLNGAAARKAHVGDLLIICTYSPVADSAVPGWKPRVVLLGENNRITDIKKT